MNMTKTREQHIEIITSASFKSTLLSILNPHKRINTNLNQYFNRNIWNVISYVLDQDTVQSINQSIKYGPTSYRYIMYFHISSLLTQPPSHLQRPVQRTPALLHLQFLVHDLTHPHCRRMEQCIVLMLDVWHRDTDFSSTVISLLEWRF